MAKSASTRGMMSNEAAQVFAECAFATAQGIEGVMQGRPYRLADAARDYWVKIHTVSIPRALKRPNANWKFDQLTVLPMAQLLGAKAATFASTGIRRGTIVIRRSHVERASKEVRNDRRCKAALRLYRAKSGGPAGGAGGYCDVA